MSLSAVVALAGGTAALSWAAIGRLRQILLTRGVIDVPNARSSHDRPVPRGAGAVVTIGVVAASLIGWWLFGGAEPGLVGVLLTAAVVSGIGLLDDLQDLSVRVRLALQTGLAVTLCALLLMEARPGPIVSAALLMVGTVWLVGVVNITNFMDGIDGIAGLTGIGVGVGAVGVGFVLGSQGLAVVGSALVGAMAGFLVHNWHPARIFLGDSGSLLLGWLAASLPLVAFGVGQAGFALMLPLLPFLVDGALTLIWRWRRGERVTEAHRSHLYQRAARRWGHAQVAGAYGAAAIGLAIVAMTVAPKPPVVAALTIGVVLVTVMALWGVGTAAVRDRSPR